MGLLKRFDLFKAIAPEHKQGSLLGSILTLVIIVMTFIFIYKEVKVYKGQKLITNLAINKT